MSLVRYTKTDMAKMVAIAEEMNDGESKPPQAPMKKYKKSSRILELMKRWEARGIVRELYPELNAKNPQYFKEVDKVYNVL
jgi:hypothetical protein